MPIENISILLNYFFGSTTVVSIYIAWKSRKASIRKANAEAQKEEITAISIMSELYDKVSASLKKDYERMQKRIDELEIKVKEYETRCKNCQVEK
ncbi:hypothetical protein [Flavobacterium sp. UBA4197]|uniref:hypothetical protein n=1 Tax=Flavobacterium sp. UBA4197 TaxID=1946546 RepID=UPI00257C80D6|nr:hypothetical protein [Flavobacterium sp. UBA4197]HRB72443.1 hypothetical protein [Flavobacterium sp.]